MSTTYSCFVSEPTVTVMQQSDPSAEKSTSDIQAFSHHGKRKHILRVWLRVLTFGLLMWIFLFLHKMLDIVDSNIPDLVGSDILHIVKGRSSSSRIDRSISDSKFYAFAVRDAKRIVPNQPPRGMHIFDFVDVHAENQSNAPLTKLYVDAREKASPLCNEYSLACYNKKIVQAFQIALNETSAPYFFYIESDNDVCVSLHELEDLAYRWNRYFISVGLGASGWIMSRDFMHDFIAEMLLQEGANFGPDVIAAKWLVKRRSWSVSRQYLVSHTIVPSAGSNGLTIRNGEALEKHLPRCFEPHRGVWGGGKYDMYGWDYFDYNLCPDSEVFPCGENQIPKLAV